MSKDRTIATDALEVLGLPDLGGKDVGRDAIHLAVEPSVAAHYLMPGQRIRRRPDGTWEASAGSPHQAIVDPFLPDGIVAGSRFLAVIPPRQITSLRHVWEHPDFPTSVGEPGLPAASSPEPESSPAMFAPPRAGVVRVQGPEIVIAEAESRLRALASDLGKSYDALMDDLADGYVSNYSGDGVDAYEGLYDDYYAMTGKHVPQKDRQNYFSCSC